MTDRRFPWVSGEKEDPAIKEATEVMERFEKCVAQARLYLNDGCYAPLGGMMQYLAADANKIKRSCGKLMMKYGR
jgi:hypothetical protein